MKKYTATIRDADGEYRVEAGFGEEIPLRKKPATFIAAEVVVCGVPFPLPTGVEGLRSSDGFVVKEGGISIDQASWSYEHFEALVSRLAPSDRAFVLDWLRTDICDRPKVLALLRSTERRMS